MIVSMWILIGVVTVPLAIFKKWKALYIFLAVICGIGIVPLLVELFYYHVPLSAELGRIGIILTTFGGSCLAVAKHEQEKKKRQQR